MPTWSEILNELKLERIQNPQSSPFDTVRRKYLTKLSQHTGRNTILYASNWTSPTGLPIGQLVTINEEDIQGLMEVIHGLTGEKLDLILHSPGGSAEATEAFVSYLRTKFKDIRVIIPYAAMSAATMLACSGNKIVMGKHSFVGPIDPQMVLQTQVGLQNVPAQAILDQFEMAKEECKDPKNLNSWFPILGQYGPALLKQCQNHIELSRVLVSQWLKDYMFAGDKDAETKAKGIANYLSDHKQFNTHARHINRTDAISKGLVIEELESDQIFQDLVLSVFHATTHTFVGAGVVKIIENHLGKAFIKAFAPVVAPQPSGQGQPPTKPPGSP